VGRVATRNADGRWIRAFGVVRDITERKRLSEQLQSAAGEWQATFDSINDLVMILDCEYRILRINAATVRFFGLPRERIVGSTCFTLMHGTNCPIDGCPCQKSFQTKQSSELELFHTGSGKWLLISTDPIRDTVGNVIGVVHVGRDISDRKQAEAELQRLRLNLWHADRVAQTGAITASLAHELNQPLTAILSNAQAGLRFMDAGNPDLGEIRAILADIVHDDKRAGAVISGLRSMLRRKETQRATINLASTIEEVLALVHSELVGQQVELRLGLDADFLVLADKGQVQQVILNLVMNAMQAMQGQPAHQRRLVLTLTRTHTGDALVTVRDSGPGVPEEQQGKLFEAFWTTKNQGLGIGLHISRSIIESHGGRLFFANNPDRGATFSFTLPFAMPAGSSRSEDISAAGPGAP
jgi:PAS domain S-box-containing protein